MPAKRAARAPEPPAPAPPPDEVGEALRRHGLVASRFTLDLNHALQVPYNEEMPAPWHLPSRLFRFPIETHRPERGQPRRLGLVHPALAAHPFVRRVRDAGFEIAPGGAPNAYGYTLTDIGPWWHAVDLASEGRWDDLLATMRFTTRDHVAHAVGFVMQTSGRKLTAARARELLLQTKVAPPARRPDLAEVFLRPSPIRASEKSREPESWPINLATLPTRHADVTWTLIRGLEDGTLAYNKSGRIEWSPRGRERFETTRRPVQLDLFAREAAHA
jgi:hypothetical protein